ncbi:MAG TPA: phosphoribosylformylglycinamidine synthase subunit PurS [Candidatus Omnitrophota bacterium]|nr:phosphoribosylformylglycinamidine synthase subunit PurS [Candidatus Omnitrophota bacterium]
MFNAEVYVSLKNTVADPQGLTVKHALESLGYKGLKDVRMGKLVRLRLDSKDKAAAEAEVRGMCEKLLANPIIEEFSFKIEEAK